MLGSSLLGLALLVTVLPAKGDDWRLNSDFSVTANDVSGSGDDSSSLTEGVRYLGVLNLHGNGMVQDYQYSLNLAAKTTDDPRNDVEKFSLTNLQGRLSNQIHTLTAGDTFESFSQYTLNTAVKGLSYRYEDAANRLPDVTLVAGAAFARWDNFWGNDTVERQVLGARLRQHLTNDLWVALNYVQSDDHQRVDGVSLYDTRTIGMDWQYLPIIGLTIRGESAWINNDESTASDRPDTSFSGSAHKIEAIGDGGPSRVSLEYERISPEFVTVLGSATPDREKVKARWRYRPSKRVTWNYGMLWFRDNLDGDLVERTDHYRPEVGVSLRQLGQRRYSVVSMNYKYDRAYGSRSTSDHFITAGYRDRFGIFDSDTNIGITFYDTNTVRKDQEYLFNTTLSTRKTVGEWILRPSLRVGVWTLEDELANDRDDILEYSLGLGVDAPHYHVTSSLRVGQNKLQKENGMDTEKMFANLSIYYRPEFLASLSNARIYLRGLVNDFGYNESGRDFRENSLTAGINIDL